MDIPSAVIALLVWFVSVLIAFLLTLLSKKFEIKEKLITYSWDIAKITTGALLGSLLGGN